jgi:hypothetical protein
MFRTKKSKKRLRLVIPPLAAAIEIALIRLAGNCDVGVFVILVCWGRVGSRCGVSRGRVGWFVSRCGVSGWLVLRLVAGWSMILLLLIYPELYP